MDTRYPNVLALYTKDECFAILFEQETDLHTWLIAMLRLSRDSGDDPPKPLFGKRSSTFCVLILLLLLL